MKKNIVWSIVTLVGLYVMCQLIADIGATKFVQVGPYVLPAGTFIFAVTFTLRDMVHKRLGKDWAQVSIVMAAVFNIILSAYLWLMTRIPAPPFFALGEAWDTIFAIVPSITIASILAELVSELVDTEVYHFWAHHPKLEKWPQWTRVIASNVVSLPIDSLIFATLAFTVLPRFLGGSVTPFGVALSLVVGQTILKGVVTIISLPGIYMVKEEKII